MILGQKRGIEIIIVDRGGKMDWMSLFENHILNRGMMYCEDGKVVDFDISENRIEADIKCLNSMNYLMVMEI